MFTKYSIVHKTCWGFGEIGLESSFWLGLEPLHQLTGNGGYTRMRVEMYSDEGSWYSAEYQHFSVDNETTGYRLNISGYWGDAGNHLWLSHGQNFSTFDHGPQSSKAMMLEGGWWCSEYYDAACLNGAYEASLMYTYAPSEITGFYWNSGHPPVSPPEVWNIQDVTPGRLIMSRIMITRPWPRYDDLDDDDDDDLELW